MKHKFLKFISAFLLLMSSLTAWSDDTWTTIYYAVDASTVGCYTVKINANIGDNGTWRSAEMTKTSYTYNGKIIYTGQVNEKHGGVDCLQIQLYDGTTWKSEKQPYNSWTTSSTYSGKMYDHETEKWESYSTDASYTIYFADYYGWGNDHGEVNAYAWNSSCDYNATWNGKVMTATDKTYNGKTIYSITIDKRYTKVKISAANHSDYATGDLDCYSNSGKICIYNGSAYTWVTYNYDVTLTFNPQNGSANTTKSVLKGGNITAPSAPSKTGYTFDGWGTGKVAAGGTISNVQADATYDAQWSPITYTVAYSGNGNTGGSTASSSHTYDVAKNLTSNGFTRAYVVTYDYDGATGGNSAASATATYTFDHWTCSANANTYTDGASVTNLTSTQDATVTMTAQWNSGSVTLPTPTKTGYTFSGWYDNSTKIGDGGASYTPTEAITLTAHWTAKQTTITLDGNGATTAGTPTQITATYGQQLPTLSSFTAPEKDGFNFKGYYSATSDGTHYYNNAGTRVYDGTWASDAATATFYAQWENAATYSITVTTSPTTAFTASSGSAENITLGQAYSISATLADKGYTWKGWTAEPAANASFADASALSTTVTVNNGSVTVTANAEAKTYTLTLNGNGGAPATQDVTVTFGQPCPSFTAVEKIGYTWEGFFVNPSGGDAVILKSSSKFAANRSGWTKNSNWDKDGDATLHAQWKATKSNQIELNKNFTAGKRTGADGKAYITFDATAFDAGFTHATSSVGFTLLGYSTDAEGTNMVVNADGTFKTSVANYTDENGKWINPTFPTKLYAQWEEFMTTVTLSANPEGAGTIRISNTTSTEAVVGITTTKAASAYSIDNNAYTFTSWTATNCSVENPTSSSGGQLSGDGTNATGTLVANFTLTSCKMRWSGSSSTFYDADGEPEMNYDIEKKAYYLDFTPTSGPFYFRFKIGEAEWSADWEKSDGNVVKTAVVNGSKLDCNQDVHAWETRATVKYAGCSSYPIRVWFDYNKKQTWITADAETQWSIAGSKEEFGSWSTSKNVLVHETAGGVLWSLSINLKANTEYELKIVNRATGEYYGSTETITQSGTTTNALSTSTESNLKLTSSLAGDYKFQWSTNTEKLKVTYPVINAVTASWNSWTLETNATVENGILTYETDITEEQITAGGLEFKVISAGTHYGAGEANLSMNPDNHADWTLSAGTKGNNIGLVPSIAGHYIFKYTIDSKGLEIIYPTLPSATTTTTEARYFGETPLTFIGGNGTEDAPYLVYTDEKITITTTTLEAQDHLTAMYKFGEDVASATELTKTIEVTSIDKQSIEVKAFYQVNGYNAKGETTAKTIYYQGVATPSIALSTTQNEYNILEAPETVTISYRATNYTGSATITKDDVTWQSPSSASADYQDDLGQTVQAHTYVATAQVNGRTFTSTLVVSVYKMVKVKVADENSLFTHFYMWRNGSGQTGPVWPGETFSYQVGTTHIFYVKYPTFDRFVLNNGKAPEEQDAAQTVDVEIPAADACYAIGAQDQTSKKYACTTADCPNGLYVKDIDPVAALVGEGVLVSPQVDIEPGLDESSLAITFDYKDATGISCDQRGRSFMVTATQTASNTQTIEVTYSIEGAEPVTKEVTINVTEAIMIQAKYGNLGWADHNQIYIHYWGTGVDGTINMTWKDYVGEDSNKQDRVYARIPLDSNHQINFQIYAWNMDDDKQWHITNDVINVTEAGCYIITAGEENSKRNIAKDGTGLCWTAYYVEVDMNNGTVYRSNTVDNTTDIVSFFAPGQNETVSYKRGVVRIMENGTHKGEVASSTFATSGVYTATITEGGAGLANVALYTGDYYIRTDGANGHWDEYKTNADNKFVKFDKIESSTYDRYWVKNLKPAQVGDNVNLQACVANDYNENLANKIVSSSYTDANGDVKPDANGVNVRFGYDPATNNFERAIIMGAASNAFLNVIGDNVYKEQACTTLLNTQNEDSKFADKEQWVYEKDVFVKINSGHTSSVAKLQSQDFNGNVMYQLGFTIDPNTGKATTTPKTFGLIAVGTSDGTYKIHLVYDFKTNRMVSGWTPEGEISGNVVLDADMLLVRKHQEAAQQIRFSNDGASISKIKHLYGVMEIEKNKMIAAEATTMYELHLYWISFPFDVKVSSIFGVGTYGVEWKLQRYDGAERASKGWFKGDGTTTFWKDMTIDETLKANEGYILNLKPSAFDKAECEIWNHGRTVAAFYFPSVLDNVGLIKADSHEQSIPEHECKIDREFEVEGVSGKQNHKITDSHWNVMGIPAFQDAVPSTSEDGFHAVYKWVPSTNTYDVQEVNNEFPLQTMYAYMVQYHGTINWQNVSVISKAPYAYADDKNYTIELFFNGNGAEDHTYIKLADEASTDFVLNEDMMKIDNAGYPNIYSFAGNYNVAYNETKMTNQSVTIGVSAPKNGSYTFSMPKDFSGSAILVDLESGEATDLNLSDYTVDLNKGTYNNRFQLVLEVEAKTPTKINNAKGEWNADGKTKKLFINDQIYLINAGRVYNATGTMVK